MFLVNKTVVYPIDDTGSQAFMYLTDYGPKKIKRYAYFLLYLKIQVKLYREYHLKRIMSKNNVVKGKLPHQKSQSSPRQLKEKSLSTEILQFSSKKKTPEFTND